MRSTQNVPLVRDLLLIGGGHSHVQVLRRLAMQELPGVRVTMIARELHTPYSGMLPGLIAGHYRYDDAHIDLGPLTTAAGVRLIEGEVIGLDLGARVVRLAGRPPLRYDVISLDTGAVPGVGGVQMDAPVIAVKPIGRFLERWEALKLELERVTLAGRRSTIAVVGGGAGGVELCFAVEHLLRTRRLAGRLVLLHDGAELLPGHGDASRAHLRALLEQRGVTVRCAFHVARVTTEGLADADGGFEPADAVLWVTGVQAAAWPRAAGLATDDAGFVRVDNTLRSVSHPEVYATGDMAALDGQPRPKSGVYAVRQGPALARNLFRVFEGKRPRRYRAQRDALALISEGGQSATLSRGRWFAHGHWLWRVKDWIDRRFMARFALRPAVLDFQPPGLPPAIAADLPDRVRCGGCAAKLPADLLGRVLRRLDVGGHADVLEGIGGDAAILRGDSSPLVLSLDALRGLTDDPHRFGRIAVEHALSDVFTTGARPTAALAIVTIPLMGEAQMEEDLFQIMHAAREALSSHGVALVGGHTMEGEELTLGFAVTGRLSGSPMRKRGLVPGDALVLTKPLGSGVVLAGAMRGMSKSRWVSALLGELERSNGPAAGVIVEAGALACTDVTGFGLIGHLAEMLRASDVSCDIDAGAIAAYTGALELLEAGIRSSLHGANTRVLDAFSIAAPLDDPRVLLLADPQTGGGLLAGIAGPDAAACVERLHEAGVPQAAIIGRVTKRGNSLGRVSIGGRALHQARTE